ncbi:uncharacterized protein LOC143188098 [Calliopsis andreniformis]|uniref:uncharacterized protein LOC143188098 n=1 Tax=Calliopsis andreniformis TaxID=337506 RepID=UPI003FCE2E7A
MKVTFLYAITLLVFLVLLQQPIESKKVTIHIPYRVKKVKHTHTVYKIVPHYPDVNHEKKDSDEDDNDDR